MGLKYTVELDEAEFGEVIEALAARSRDLRRRMEAYLAEDQSHSADVMRKKLATTMRAIDSCLKPSEPA